MKVVALISGGKDSCYNMMQCVAEGHDIVALANLKPKDRDELDSYMYQSVGHHAIELYADAVGLPLYRREITGSSVSTGRDYQQNSTDEVEDLYELLKQVKTELGVEGVSVGAILSNYQRVRVENVCQRLGLTSLAYLWRRDQIELLDEMIQCGVKAIIIKVAAMGLKPKLHLGKTLAEIQPYLLKKNSEFDLNVCGEGGEYETFTLDCPVFRKRIVLDETEVVIHSEDDFAPVGYLNLRKAHLEDKQSRDTASHKDLVKDLPMKTSQTILSELFSDQDSMVCVNCGKTIYPQNTDRIEGHVQASVLTRGNNLWISNLCGINDGQTDIQTLTRDTLTQLQDVIRSCGPGWDIACLVQIHLFVKNMADFHLINSVYKTFFGINPAVRVCVQTDLPENVDLLIDCYGYCCHDERETMHVQGWSHWAPPNIGPYSQCVKINDRLYVSGQIAMIPANLSIIEGGIHPQTRLALKHTNSVISALIPGCSLNNVISCVSYLTHKDYIDVAKKEFEIATKGGSSMCSSVLYVIVPALPKGALIEWQVVASQTIHQHVKVERVVKTHGDIQVVLKIITSEDDRDVLSLSGFVYKEKGTNSVSNITEISETIQTSVTEITSKFREDSILRMFYCSTMFRYEELFTVISTSLRDLPFILIPVLGFEDESFISCTVAFLEAIIQKLDKFMST